MTVKAWYQALTDVIPSSLSCEWDNDGMMCCPNPDKEVGKIMLTLDVTEEAVSRAISESCDLIISHHPLIFHPIHRITSPKLVRLIQKEIAVFSFHTRLDALQGGVNDCLSKMLGIAKTEGFTKDGIGRVGCLTEPISLDEFALQVKKALGSSFVQTVSAGRPCYRVALLGGAGKDAVQEAIDAHSDTFVTGEISYNSMVDFGEMGINIITAGHYETENPVLSSLENICRDIADRRSTPVSLYRFNCQPIHTI